MPDRDEIRDELKAEGAREERVKRLRGRFLMLLAFVIFLAAATAIVLALWNASKLATQSENDKQREADISAALAEQDAEAQEQADILAELIATQEAYGSPVTASDLSAAIEGIQTTDPALKDALKALADKVAALEAQVPVPGPQGEPGPSGAPYSGPPPSPGPQGDPGEPGEDYDGPPPEDGVDGSDGQDGQDGQDGANGANGVDGETPQVTASLGAGGHLIISVTTSAGTQTYDVGSVVGPPGPQGPAGTALPGDYQCDAGQYLTGFTVAGDGSVSLHCQTLPIGPGSGN